MTKTENSRGILKPFLKYFRPHRGLFILDLSCALVVSLVDLAFPIAARNAMYNMLPANAYRTFFTVMMIAAVAFAVRAGLNYVITYWGHMFGVRVETDMRDDLFRHMQSLDYAFFDRNRTGQLLSRVTGDLFEITELAHHGPEDLFIAFTTIFGSIIIMFTIQWQLALVILIVIPVFVAVLFLNRRRMVKASRKVKVRLAEINGEIESGISGIRTSKAFANEAAAYSKFAGANDQFKTAKCENYRAFGLFNSTMEFFMCIMPVIVMAVGGWLIMRGRMNYADMITFYLYIAAFINPIRKLGNFMETFMNGWAGLIRFMELMRTEPEIKDRPGALTMDWDSLQAEGRVGVELRDVSFSYQTGGPVLKNVDLKIEPGQTLAVVGPSGGGKTTMCQLIPRFYDVTGGSILIGGRDVRDIEGQSLRKGIGIVQQDVFLFADTIAENIRYGRPDATDEEVIEAARRAEIYDDIMKMPEGFASYTGERGVLLSGGQKQRISIARIFLKNPPVLILDEATSALDTVTEAKIQGAFDRLAEGRTTIIIAHRLSTIRNAQKIVLIDEGRIEEEGSHRQLMELGGQYARLYRKA